MDKYFDRSGTAIDHAKIQCIDSVKGTGEYIYRVICNKCKGRGERKHFYKSRCIACNATGYSLVTTRTCYTLNALYRTYPEAARKISAAQEVERQHAFKSKSSAFSLWCQSHQEMVDAITQQDGENSFLNSLKSTLSRKYPLSDKQLTVAARILGI
ncbi:MULTISPECIES: hypothetical protein [Escherichia]|uniref:hypothetical protein n=1 Tax=Escherichia TaxID=561 RepID=UPI000BE3535B|nr:MULTISPECIES: hypothetical protein [Escherichia]EFH7156831.1 hypothetical protein [Escherichia coli]EFS7178560.1 hypothetical protein [Escherichia coli]EGF1626152.1 hypothetical protein [Escherichia coli]EIK8055897.1 hypothetical protein [Escherichia coli]EKR5117407.1 hypothetical protein [Escherichia coli]